MDRQEVKQIQAEIRDAIKSVCERHHLELTKNNCSYSSVSMSLRLELSSIGTGGENLVQKSNFERYSVLYGLKPEDLGRQFNIGVKTFKLIDIKPDRPKYPFIAAEVGTNRQYKFPADTVQRALGIQRNPVISNI